MYSNTSALAWARVQYVLFAVRSALSEEKTPSIAALPAIGGSAHATGHAVVTQEPLEGSTHGRRTENLTPPNPARRTLPLPHGSGINLTASTLISRVHVRRSMPHLRFYSYTELQCL